MRNPKGSPPPIHYACSAPVLLQGGDFACDFCTEKPTLTGPHRGAAIADGANLWTNTDPTNPLDDLLVGGTAGVWLKDFPLDWAEHTGTVALFPASVAGIPQGASGTSCHDDTDAALRLISLEFGDLYGFSVCTIGDLDDDGFDEFLVGAPRGPFQGVNGEFAPWEGRVYLYLSGEYLSWTGPDWSGGSGSCKVGCQFCSANALLSTCDFPGHYSAVPRASAILAPPPLDGEGPGPQYFGFSLENLGDLDGDGVDDVGIGAPNRDNRTTNPALVAEEPGRAYIISGAKLWQSVQGPGQEALVVGDGLLPYTGAPSATDALLLGTLTPDLCEFGGSNGDRVGHAMVGNVDLDADGDLDVAIGAPQYRWLSWQTGLKKYSVQSTGAGRVVAVAGGPWTQGGPQSGAPTTAVLDGIWFLDVDVEYASVISNSPDYGEAFGFSVSARRKAPASGNSASWDLVVGAPLFSETPPGTLAAQTGMPPYTFLGWGPFGDPTRSRAIRMATVWDWPDGPVFTPPSVANWHYKGVDVGELAGWKVKALGDIDLVAGGVEDIGICTRNFSTSPRDSMGACTAPCFQEAGPDYDTLCPNPATTCTTVGIPSSVDDNGGGLFCGSVTLHRVTDGAIRLDFRGEDTRDSLGWGIALLENTVSDTPQLVLGAGRWPGNNASGMAGGQPVNSLDENGRVYVFQPSSMGFNNP